MPTRYLKESICTSDNVDALSPFQETFFYRLIVNCDDYGRMDARPPILAAKLFPLKHIRNEQILDALHALSSAELVILYEVGGKPFLQMATWDKHQTCRAKTSKYPAPDDSCIQLHTDVSRCIQQSTDVSVIGIEIDNRNRESESKSQSRDARARFTPPTVDDVRAYCQERQSVIDPEEFVDFYAAKGWKIGKEPMKDWRAAVRTWEAKRREKQVEKPSKWGNLGQMV